MLLFGDGCAATLVSADETGIALQDFRATTIEDSGEAITWRVGDQGFDMHLSGEVPGKIARALRFENERNDDRGLLRGTRSADYDLWAVHAGGRTILDAVETGFELAADKLDWSRSVLRDFRQHVVGDADVRAAAHPGQRRRARSRRFRGRVRAGAGGGELPVQDGRLNRMRSFAARSPETEMMDANGVSAADFAACLADLATVNTVTIARPPTLHWLAAATARLRPGDRFSLLDVGYGEGDMLRAVHRWATRRGLVPELAGVDLNPLSAPAAIAATDPALGIDYRTGNVFDQAPVPPPDYIVSSLVTHHLSDDEVVAFLRWMERTARKGWFVNDLHRHWLAFYGFRVLAWAARWHRFVRHDGPVSVARSFRRADWERLLAGAGIDCTVVTLRWEFPFRLCVGRLK